MKIEFDKVAICFFSFSFFFFFFLKTKEKKTWKGTIFMVDIH
jgi:hypothetical protein